MIKRKQRLLALPESKKEAITDPRASKAIPWQLIERQFIQGVVEPNGEITYPTISELAEIHSAPYSSLRRHMLEGQWLVKRDEFQAQMHKWVHAASAEEYIEAAQKFDSTCITAAQTALNAIVQHLAEAIHGGADNDKGLPSQLDLDRLGRAAVNWQKVGRLALGLSTENNAQKTTFATEQQQTLQPNVSLLNENELTLLETFFERSVDAQVIVKEVQEEQ